MQVLFCLQTPEYSLDFSTRRIQHSIWISLPEIIGSEKLYIIQQSYYYFLIIHYRKYFTSIFSKTTLSTLRAQPSAFKHLFSSTKAYIIQLERIEIYSIKNCWTKVLGRLDTCKTHFLLCSFIKQEYQHFWRMQPPSPIFSQNLECSIYIPTNFLHIKWVPNQKRAPSLKVGTVPPIQIQTKTFWDYPS